MPGRPGKNGTNAGAGAGAGSGAGAGAGAGAGSGEGAAGGEDSAGAASVVAGAVAATAMPRDRARQKDAVLQGVEGCGVRKDHTHVVGPAPSLGPSESATRDPVR